MQKYYYKQPETIGLNEETLLKNEAPTIKHEFKLR